MSEAHAERTSNARETHVPESHMRLDTYLAEKLREDGYGGLCNDWCGCSLDDLMACSSPSPLWCRPGYLHLCDSCSYTEDDCPIDDRPSFRGYCVGIGPDFPEARHD